MNGTSPSLEPSSPEPERVETTRAVTPPTRPLEVLFINDTARNGGPGRSLFYILKFLDPGAVRRTVILPREGVLSDLYRKGGVAEEVRLHPIVENIIEPSDRPMVREDFNAPLPVRSARLLSNVARAATSMATLIAYVRRGRFDLVYCNGTTANFIGGALALATSTPVLWHVRYTGLAPAIRPLHAFLARQRGVRRIVCVSAAAAALFPKGDPKVKVVNNAIDPAEFSTDFTGKSLRRELGLEDDAIIVGCHGRVLPRKGFIEFIRGAALALEQMTEEERARTRFVVLGDTPEDLRPDHLAECKALASELGVERKVLFLGFRADVKPYVSEFDVAVVPSIYADALPRAVLESMAMGKPVLAFDVGGVSEMVTSGETGTLLPVPSEGGAVPIDALAREMLRYLRDASLRQRHGAAGRARVHHKFSAENHARAILAEIRASADESAKRRD